MGPRNVRSASLAATQFTIDTTAYPHPGSDHLFTDGRRWLVTQVTLPCES